MTEAQVSVIFFIVLRGILTFHHMKLTTGHKAVILIFLVLLIDQIFKILYQNQYECWAKK